MSLESNINSNVNVKETLEEIRGRVSARLSRTVPEIPELALPPLDPLRQARGVAEGWSAAMGVVNPRPPGVVNSVAQQAKKLVARGLRWFAFPQTQFNSGAVAALVRTEDMFADVNRNMVVLGQNLVDRQRKQTELEHRMKDSEAGALYVIEMLRREIDAQARRIDEMQRGIDEQMERRFQQMSAEFTRSLEQISQSVSITCIQISESVAASVGGIQSDVERVEERMNQARVQFAKEFEHVKEGLEAELRLVRQRSMASPVAPAASVAIPIAAAAVMELPAFDYSHFEQRFRGHEEEIVERQRFYLPMLREKAPVLDIACGRGEMLDLLREQGIDARGVDLDSDMVARCQDKHLAVERADALAYLEGCAEASLGAVFSAQFVEHLPVAAYSRMIELAFSRLRAGGRLILETQNPECLAIYSQSFYLDPTHVRPVPAKQLRFLLEEAGFRDIEVHYLSPLNRADLPELPLRPGDEAWNVAAARFNEMYFGHMDYGITGVKPA